MLCAPDGTDVSLPFKVEFPGFINEAEYEFLIIGWIFVSQMGIWSLLSREIPWSLLNKSTENL